MVDTSEKNLAFQLLSHSYKKCVLNVTCFILGLIVIVSLPIISNADSPPSNHPSLPIDITSDELDAQKNEHLIIFTGNVVAKQGDVTMKSNELYVYYDEDNKAIEKLVALGDVKIYQQDKSAYGEQAVFIGGERMIRVSGNPRLSQGGDTVAGQLLEVYLDENRIIVKKAKATVKSQQVEIRTTR